MESLRWDLLPGGPGGNRNLRAAELLGVDLHSFDSSVECSLREWERSNRSRRGELMSLVTASIQIAAPPEDVWKMVMDPSAWVIGSQSTARCIVPTMDPHGLDIEMDQQIHLRGVNIDVHWKLVECNPCKLAVWEGRGPARSRARTEYVLSAEGDGGTRFDYRNEFHPPLGPLGAIVSRALVGGMPEREARRTLDRLRSHFE